MRTQRLLLMTALLIGGGAAGLMSQEASKAPPSADETAIRKSAQAYVQAFEKQDAKALAGLWSPKGVYTDAESGRRVQGRDAIEAEFKAQFKKDGPSKLRVSVQSVRFVTPDVAIEDGTATVSDSAGESSDSTYSAVHVRQDGKWLLDSVRETVLPTAGPASERLKDLSWLVGKWVDADEHAVVHSEYNWTANHAFLTHAFTVYVEDRVSMRGMQLIGWDAAAKKIRSWAFDSAGGFAEGSWEQDGDRWVIHSKSTLPDGKRGSAINILRKIDDDHLTWKSTARQVDGEMLPNVDEIEIVREEAADDAASDNTNDDGEK